jgi:hypothetical protein
MTDNFPQHIIFHSTLEKWSFLKENTKKGEERKALYTKTGGKINIGTSHHFTLKQIQRDLQHNLIDIVK